MANVQHAAAHQLLPHIAEAVRKTRNLNYEQAAALIGRDPSRNRRMIAQVCDLLDAAAELAGVPLLALIMVREQSNAINRRAFASAGDREGRLHRSFNHSFSENDFESISSALTSLAGMGNRKAWQFVEAHKKTAPINRAYPSKQSNSAFDAINDLGGDEAQRLLSPPSYYYARDAAVRDYVMARAQGHCELCGARGFSTPANVPYLESHHIIALSKDGRDSKTNVIALCAAHHREAHFGKSRASLERKMIEIVRVKEAVIT